MADDPVRQAERLDEEIARALAGAPPAHADPIVLWLATALRPAPPRALERAVAARALAPAARAWNLVRVAALALAAVLATHGLGSLVSGEWVARNIGEPFGAHAFTEGGLALLAAAIAVGAAALRRAWLPVGVAAGTPLGLVLGVRGVPELGEFAWGAALHLTEGACALALLATWWWARRYGSGAAPEVET